MKHKHLVIQSFDLRQRFDFMSLDITILNLFGVCNALPVLLDAANRNIKMKVNTFYGTTEPIMIQSLRLREIGFPPSKQQCR